ncbi:GspH/FimT family pseudopilin [Alkalimarinus alittae]|uniref:Type II secretion system protein H n=1 Tax=Alkalimarinus alittae TaxID=2961619 RepID=A0ABY6N0S8_9ALTE|nr:GspH/FimT family pseudopilin [Alkalimarinus alittae]UZE95599.1 GspH/FimT family pseudopilin [Alkalimarinus alittae]
MNCRGLSLIEVLITLAIITLLTGLGIANFSSSINQTQVDAQLLSLRQLFSASRQKAIDTQDYITVCPSDDSVNCSYQWEQPIIAFSDRNKNAMVDHDETIWITSKLFNITQPLAKKPSNKPYFRYSPEGYTQGSPGNIQFCGANQQANTARKFTLSMAGRTRLSSDKNKDGIHEDSRGIKLNCPN